MGKPCLKQQPSPAAKKKKKRLITERAVVMHSYNPSNQEVEIRIIILAIQEAEIRRTVVRANQGK
jgi:hypothetical protein